MRTNVRNRMVSNMRRNKHDIPLRDRIAKQMDRGMTYPTMNKGIKEWCRIGKDCKHYVSSWINGPKFSNVISRTTYDMYSGRIINHLVFSEHTNGGDLHNVMLFKSE